MAEAESEQSGVCVIYGLSFRDVVIIPMERLLAGTSSGFYGDVVAEFPELSYHLRSRDSKEERGVQFEPSHPFFKAVLYV